MQVREVIETLGLKLMTHEVPVDVDVIGGYASDLLATSLPAYDVIGKLYELGIRNVK